MTITREIIQEKLDSSDNSWFIKGGNRSRVKRFLKANQLDNEMLTQLWNIERIQRDLANTQKLPDDIIESCLYYSKLSIFKEILDSQEIKPEHIKIIANDVRLFVISWQHIPDTLYGQGYYDLFLERIFDESVDIHDQKIQHSIIDVLRWRPSTFDDIFKKIKEKSNDDSLAGLIHIDIIELLARYIFFPDEFIHYLKQELINENKSWGTQWYNKIMDILISRDHCSVNMKASYLLQK